MTANTPSLEVVRARIDELDQNLLALLNERAAMPDLVKAAKQAQAAGPGFGLRPAREAQLIRRLLALPHPAASPALIVRIWRELIGDSLCKQGPFRLVAWGGRNPARVVEMARFRFGAAPPLVMTARPEEALQAAKAEGVVAVLELDPGSSWWARLLAEPSLSVIGALPCLTAWGAPMAVAIAAIEAEPSGADQTFWVSDSALPVRRLEEALGELGVAAELVLDVSGLRLMSLGGYMQRTDPRLQAAPGRLKGVIGAAPLPFDL